MYVEDYKILQNWISGALKNMCDADPSALAKFIIAMLKKDTSEPELKSLLLDHLDMFLQGETYRFVDKLLVALNDKSYLPPLEKLHSVPSNVHSFQHPYKDIKSEELKSHGGKLNRRINNQHEKSCFSNWNKRVATTTLQSKVDYYECELNRLKKELKARNDYVRDLETQVATLKKTIQEQNMCSTCD